MELTMLERAIFSMLLAGAMVVAAVKVGGTVRLIRRGREAGAMAGIWSRLGHTFLRIPLQRGNLRSVSLKDPSGIVHVVLFWGASLLGLYFLAFPILGEGLGMRGFSRETPLWAWLSCLSQWVGILLAPAMGFAAARRLFKKPERLGPEFDGAVFAVLTAGVFLLVIAMLINQGLRALLSDGGNPALPARIVSGWFEGSRVDIAVARGLFKASWWVEVALLMGLMVYAPFSKHRHPIYGPLNIFFRLLRHPKRVEPLDLTPAGRLGASRPAHLTRKQLLESFSCAQCGRCQEVCPAYATGKPFSPKSILMDVKERLEKGNSLFDLRNDALGLLSCTMCGACYTVCPLTNRPLEVVLELRRGLIYEGIYEAGHQEALKKVSRDHNPLGRRRDQRGESLSLKKAREGAHYDCIYWLGCLAGFDETARGIAQATASILERARVDFAVLGTEEACCGDFVRRLGDEGLFQELARRNLETLGRYDFDFILTHCPHCYNVLSNEYAVLGGELKVVHHSRFMEELLDGGRIKTQRGKERIVFHDPCYLGRFNDIYDAPRRVLSSMTPDPLEFPLNRANSFCCGAGGGHVWRETEPGEKMSVRRLKELSENRPDVVATSCPFCLMMLQEASLILDDTPDYRITDLAQLVLENMQ